VQIRHRLGRVVAVIEIVSPGNKGRRNELRSFVEKSCRLISQGVNLLVIDIFPPAKRDSQGLAKLIWDEFIEEDDFGLPRDTPLSLAAYDAGPPVAAYIEPVGVGDPLPEMPIFLEPGLYVPAPLESTYLTSWHHLPSPMKQLVEGTEPR
jgi:hypothetical protein